MSIKLTGKSTLDDILCYKKVDMQIYLRDRKAKQSGTKLQLAERVFELNKENVIVDAEINTKPVTKDSSPGQSVSNPINLDNVPEFHSLTQGWSGDKDHLPSVSHLFIEDYLINSSHRTHDHDKMECCRQFVRGYTFFREGYVHKLMCNLIDDGSTVIYVKSKCKASMKNDTYTQWILMDKTTPHHIQQAYCSCPAGLGEGCTHIAGLLFALEETEIHLDENASQVPCTSKPCQWNQPGKRKVNAQPIEKIAFKKFRHGAELKTTPKQHAFPSVDSEKFRDALCNKLDGRSVIFDLIQHKVPSSDDVCSDLNVVHSEVIETTVGSDIIYKTNRYIYLTNTIVQENMDDTSFINHFINTPVPSEITCAVEEKTRGQHLNAVWFAARNARITASNFHDIRNRQKACMTNLVNKYMSSKHTDARDTIAMKWGRVRETVARKGYINSEKAAGRKLVIDECGLFIHPHHSYLGASPDGIVSIQHDGNTSQYVLEIKCPYKWKDSSVEDACRHKAFFCSVDDNDIITLKTNHKYYTQIQGQMAVCNMDRCDLVIYTTKNFRVVQIPFNTTFWESLLVKLNKFYLDHMLPALTLHVDLTDE